MIRSAVNRYGIPLLRRTVQALGVALIVLLPLIALFNHYNEARAIGDLPQSEWRAAALRGIDSYVADHEGRKEALQQTQGTLWSLRISGWSLSDPLAGAEAIVTSRSFYRPLLVSLLIPFFASVLLGRIFCGWICPMNTLLELVDKCRSLVRFLEIRQCDVKFSLRNKYVMLAVGLGVAALTATPFFALVYPPAILSREAHLFVFGAGVGLGIYFILGICVMELLVSRRWWCRYVCPGGALYSMLGRFRVVRVRRDEQKCVQCGDCVAVCQFDLRPMLVQTTGMECTNCGTCISNCDSDALDYRFVLPLPARPADRPKPPLVRLEPDADTRRERDSGVLIKLGIVLVCTACFTPTPSRAHHILGLPHYSYKDNYPQAPTLEYPATTGPYDVLMTSYPGNPVVNQAAIICFYIKHRETGRPYEKPVTVRVLKTSTFGSNREVYQPATHEPFDNQHKYTVTFPVDGEYIVELTMDLEGQTEVIPFLMVVGNPTATVSILSTIGVALAVFVLTVRAIKKKRQRRQAALRATPSGLGLPAAANS